MAWYSFTVALTVPPAEAALQTDPKKLMENKSREGQRLIFASSRRGVLLATLRNIVAGSSIGSDLYLLQDAVLLKAADIQREHDRLSALLAELEQNPQIVVEATKEPHAPSGTLHASGFQPLPYELVYPPSCTLADGWVYFYSKEQVREIIAASTASPDPKPANDDEGESLLYVFAFMKSHVWLLREAMGAGMFVAYAETNPVS